MSFSIKLKLVRVIKEEWIIIFEHNELASMAILRYDALSLMSN